MNYLIRLILTSFVLTLWSIVGFSQENDKSDSAKKRRLDDLKAKVMRARENNEGLKVGEKAPTFVLKSLDGKAETNLSELIKQKPVVLIFGSYS